MNNDAATREVNGSLQIRRDTIGIAISSGKGSMTSAYFIYEVKSNKKAGLLKPGPPYLLSVIRTKPLQ